MAEVGHLVRQYIVLTKKSEQDVLFQIRGCIIHIKIPPTLNEQSMSPYKFDLLTFQMKGYCKLYENPLYAKQSLSISDFGCLQFQQYIKGFQSLHEHASVIIRGTSYSRLAQRKLF